MTDKAIDWIGQQKALMADKPFFMAYAPGATHAPHHVPRVVGLATRAVDRWDWPGRRPRPPEGAGGHPSGC